jgi:hypothetical protein
VNRVAEVTVAANQICAIFGHGALSESGGSATLSVTDGCQDTGR